MRGHGRMTSFLVRYSVRLQRWLNSDRSSTDAVLHREYMAYQKRLASRLATKWDKSYSVVVAWVRVQTQFAIIRAVDLRLRGTRRRLVGLTLQDGAGLGVGH